MRKILCLSLFVVFIGWSGWSQDLPAESEPVRIMPLGDSITSSGGGHASYRYWLWHKLLDAGYDVNFVGGQYGVYRGQPSNDDFDQDHEGHWGWRADSMVDRIYAWSLPAEPDIVLIHLGTNDLLHGRSVSSTMSALEQITNEIRRVNPEAKFLLAQIIPSTWGGGLDLVPELNAHLEELAARLTRPASPVLLVNQYAEFDAAEDTWDGIHPNESGERKMAAIWFTTLVEVLGDPGSPGSDD